MSDIDPIVKAAVDAWLAEVENFGLRAERVPEGALPWLYEAAMVGMSAMREADREAEFRRVTETVAEGIKREINARARRNRTIIGLFRS